MTDREKDRYGWFSRLRKEFHQGQKKMASLIGMARLDPFSWQMLVQQYIPKSDVNIFIFHLL
jgi:hypothetical protein